MKGLVGVLAGTLLVATASVSVGQTLNESDALNKKVLELYNAGKYTEAIPLAHVSWRLTKKPLVHTIQMWRIR
jgi:hypothetical protein